MARILLVRNSPIHGKGVFAQTHIRAGCLVARYRGELKNKEQASLDDAHGVESGHTFLFALNEELVVDASRSRCAAKWFNHSCQPNCESVLFEHLGDDRHLDRIMFRSITDIAAGDEMTLDYGICLPVRHTRRMRALWACHCGSPQCSGSMLKRR